MVFVVVLVHLLCEGALADLLHLNTLHPSQE